MDNKQLAYIRTLLDLLHAQKLLDKKKNQFWIKIAYSLNLDNTFITRSFMAVSTVL